MSLSMPSRHSSMCGHDARVPTSSRRCLTSRTSFRRTVRLTIFLANVFSSHTESWPKLKSWIWRATICSPQDTVIIDIFLRAAFKYNELLFAHDLCPTSALQTACELCAPYLQESSSQITMSSARYLQTDAPTSACSFGDSPWASRTQLSLRTAAYCCLGSCCSCPGMLSSGRHRPSCIS